MPIISNINVQFNTSASLLGESTYGYNIYRYPIDLGSADKGHYMVIHINAQKKTQFQTREAGNGDLPTIYDNRIQSGNLGIGGAIGSIAPNLDFGTDFLNGLGISGDDLSVGFVRTIYRTTDTIALYMPDTLAFSQNQQYTDLSLAGALSTLITTGASLKNTYDNSGKYTDYLRNLSPFVANFAQGNDFLRAGFAAVTGTVINPMLEVIYSSPEFRVFRFDFMFYPRSQQEASSVQLILERLRFHQSPEIKKDSYGFFLIPPSEFDIKFYYNGYENPNIPKISTCVLTNIDIDYAPQGFAAYEVPDQDPSIGGTGMPVGIRLSLEFKETEYLTKDSYQQV